MLRTCRFYQYRSQSASSSHLIGSQHQKVLYNALNTLGLVHHEKQQQQYRAEQQQYQKQQQQQLTPAMLKRAYLKKSLQVHPDTAKHFNNNNTAAHNNNNSNDTTKEFQELGEALSIAMKYVQDQQHNFAGLRETNGGDGGSNGGGATLQSIQESYLRHLRDLGSSNSNNSHRYHHHSSPTDAQNDNDYLQSLQNIVSSCSRTRKSFRHINTTSDSMAERLCSRRSFDVLNIFSPNLLLEHQYDDSDTHKQQQQREHTAPGISSNRPTTTEDCAKAFNLFITILPNIVSRLRRITPSSSSSSFSSSSPRKTLQEDFNAIQTAHKFGFQPCVLIGGMIIHDGDFCGLVNDDNSEDKHNNDDILFKKLLARQNFLSQQQQEQQQQQQQNSPNNKNFFTSSDLYHNFSEGKLAQKLLKVHPELICCIGLKSLLQSSSSSSSFQMRTQFLDRIAPSLFEWQIRSARRLKTENRLLVSCRSLALEMGAIFPELSCIPDLNLSNQEAEKFADKIEDIISKTTMIEREEEGNRTHNDSDNYHSGDTTTTRGTNDRNGTNANSDDASGVTEEQRQLMIEAGERLDARPHVLSAQTLRKHMISCILVDDKQFDTLVMTVTGKTKKKKTNQESDEKRKTATTTSSSQNHNNNKNTKQPVKNDHQFSSEQDETPVDQRRLFDPDAPSTASTSHIIDPHQYGVLVSRSRTACRIEDQQFEVIIKVGDTPDETANHFINAANILYYKARSSFEAMPHAVADREASLVQCISRVFTMSAIEEKMFWQQVKRRGEFLRNHESRISNIDVHFIPQHQQEQEQSSSSSSGEIGWCDSQPDGEKVTLNRTALYDAQKFDDWLEDAVAQCTLSRQANLLAQRFSLFYVSRDRNLLLPHYISFLNRYIDSAARSVIEVGTAATSSSNRPGGSSSTMMMATPIELVVGHHLEMKQDGSLVVPWDFDLSLLVSLLSSGEAERGRVLTA